MKKQEVKFGARTKMTAKCIQSRGGFEEGKTYAVIAETLKEGNLQVYTDDFKVTAHIYCHRGMTEAKEHFIF